MKKAAFLFLSIGLIVAGASDAQAVEILTSGHYDLGVAYEDGGLEPHIHGHTGGGNEYAPDEAYFWAKDNHLFTRPAGSQWDFIGVSSGEQYYKLPTTNQVGKIYLGWGAEEIDPGVLDSYTTSDSRAIAVYGADTAEWVKWQLTGISSTNGGNFSVWSGTTGVDPVWISTTDGLDASDAFWMQTAGHEHTNFGFSSAGVYDLTFDVSGTVGGSLLTKSVTYRFGVGDQFDPSAEPVPEPASMAALAIGTLALIRKRRA